MRRLLHTPTSHARMMRSLALWACDQRQNVSYKNAEMCYCEDSLDVPLQSKKESRLGSIRS
jgi:hypothetical protein